MPVGHLRFKLPEEEGDFRLAQNAWKYKHALSEFHGKVRHKYKYTGEVPKSWGEVQELFWDTLKECGCPDPLEEDL